MGAIVNLIIGLTIALLPLFLKVSTLDIGRTSRDNLLVVIMMFTCFLLPKKERTLPILPYIALFYGLFSLVLNQWLPMANIVMYQVFYAASGMIFFAAYYEKHSEEKQHYILNGMAIGCALQGVIVLFNCFDIPLWFYLIKLFHPNLISENISSYGIGSLGNRNLLTSYVALTAFGMFRKGWLYLLPLPIFSLFIANSMMGTLAFVGGLGYFLNNEFNIVKKSFLYIGSIVAMVTVYFTGLGGLDSQRFYGWGEIFKRVDLSHFLIGKGPGWFATHGIPLNEFGELMTQEHNAYLTVFNMFGMVGIALLIPSFIKFIKQKDHSKIFPAVLFAAFINSYGHFTLHQSTVAIIIIVAGAICLAEGNKNVVHMEW